MSPISKECEKCSRLASNPQRRRHPDRVGVERHRVHPHHAPHRRRRLRGGRRTRGHPHQSGLRERQESARQLHRRRRQRRRRLRGAGAQVRLELGTLSPVSTCQILAQVRIPDSLLLFISKDTEYGKKTFFLGCVTRRRAKRRGPQPRKSRISGTCTT